MPLFPNLLNVYNTGKIFNFDVAAEWDNDPRGVVWCKEPPNPAATYIMGIDPTNGITGWGRASRVKSDTKTNLGAIEIVKCGVEYERDGEWIRTPDMQVCEYAAPIDPIELGYVANVLGRIYAGQVGDQCECIIEVAPGPGGMTMRQMISLGYTNFWRTVNVGVQNSNPRPGWTATQSTIRDLWTKASRHIKLKNVRIYSPWLVEEYCDAQMDPVKGYPISPANAKGHGDRMRAFDLALWAANKWDSDIERTTEEVIKTDKRAEWNHTDITMDEYHNRVQDMFDRYSDY